MARLQTGSRMRTDADGLPIRLTEQLSSRGRQLPCPAYPQNRCQCSGPCPCRIFAATWPAASSGIALAWICAMPFPTFVDHYIGAEHHDGRAARFDRLMRFGNGVDHGAETVVHANIERLDRDRPVLQLRRKARANAVQAAQMRAVRTDEGGEFLVDPERHDAVDIALRDSLVIGVEGIGGGFEEAGKT